MVPYVGRFPEIGRRVLIAWDASRETARAINDALPVIEAADVVTVMTVCDDDKAFARVRGGTQRILRHLERHGIAAHVCETIRNGNPVSDVILSRAMDFYVDMIVAGAFQHSPLREALRGGVGRDLLKRMTVPVLMSH
jgi:nucleotide-binding universal stress UspA family protein